MDATTTTATGTAEREAAIAMVGDRPDSGRITLGWDKAYDTQDFVAEMPRLGVTPHVSQNTKGRRSAIDGRTTRHAGHAISVRIRKRIEEVFGWVKTVGGLRKTRHRGTARVGWMFTFVAAVYSGCCAHPEAAGRRGVVMPGTLSTSMIFARQRGTTGKPPCEPPLSRYKPAPQLTHFPQPAKRRVRLRSTSMLGDLAHGSGLLARPKRPARRRA